MSVLFIKQPRTCAPKRQSTLLRPNTGNSKQIFPKKGLHGLSPNFHIHVTVNDLYIPTIGLPILLQDVDRSWEYINRSHTHECGNRD
jgi:hypothetical protein